MITNTNSNFIKEAERNTPVYKKVDVVVAGGGPAGFAAAVSAARNGADVLLVEGNPFLLGQATASFVWIGGPTDILTGLSKEFVERMDDVGALKLQKHYRTQTAKTGIQPLMYHIPFDTEWGKFISFDMIEESGAKVLTHTEAVDTIVEDGVAKGIIIENKSGRQAILADVVIDATGDADLAARVGAPMDKPHDRINTMPFVMLFRIGGVNYPKIAAYARQHPEDFAQGTGVPPGEFDGENMASLQGMSGWRPLMKAALKNGVVPKGFRQDISLQTGPGDIKHGVAHIHAVSVFRRIAYDAQDVSEAEQEGRKLVRKFVEFLKTIPGLESSFLIDVAHTIGKRDSRRIIGEYVLTRKDIYDGRTFDDDITLVTLKWPNTPATEDSGFIVHPADNTEYTDEHLEETQLAPFFNVIFGVPYRCLLPKGIDRLLVAGHNISMTYMAHEPGPCRGFVSCMAFGQAAGAAAAIASKQGISPRNVDISALREKLESQGLNLRKDAIDLSEVRRQVELIGRKINHVA